MSPSEINELPELDDLPYCENVCNIARKYALDYDVEKIAEEFGENS